MKELGNLSDRQVASTLISGRDTWAVGGHVGWWLWEALSGVKGIKEQGLDPSCYLPQCVALGRGPSLAHQYGLLLCKGWMRWLSGVW